MPNLEAGTHPIIPSGEDVLFEGAQLRIVRVWQGVPVPEAEAVDGTVTVTPGESPRPVTVTIDARFAIGQEVGRVGTEGAATYYCMDGNTRETFECRTPGCCYGEERIPFAITLDSAYCQEFCDARSPSSGRPTAPDASDGRPGPDGAFRPGPFPSEPGACIVRAMPYDVTPDGLARDTEVEYFRSGGPGGQHKNKTETAVRLVHRPSGITVVATRQRSRLQNLEDAFARLEERLREANRPRKPRKATRPTAGSQRRRLAEKTRRATVKAGRGRVRDE